MKSKMNKKERFQAVCKKEAPDYMPVWPFVTTQMIYGHGLMLPDVIGKDWYDTEKITEVVLASIENVGYDIAIPSYVECGFTPFSDAVELPTKFGIGTCCGGEKPIQTKADWPKLIKKLTNFDVRTTDVQMKGALEVIKNVAQEVGDEMPLVTNFSVGASAALSLFRPVEALMEDMIEDSNWVDAMSRAATDFAIDWIRAQYEAGANSVTFLTEVIGTVMVSPEMSERFNLENIARVVETVKQEFNQETWLHIHGNMKTTKAYQYLIKLATQAGIQGFHLEENHPPEWIMENVVYRLGRPACVITHGDHILNGPVEKIREEVKDQIARIGGGRGIMMAPSCQVLPATTNENFKAWVDATHEYGKYRVQYQSNVKS
jgi:uroporphyrinogen-III decarboxylase